MTVVGAVGVALVANGVLRLVIHGFVHGFTGASTFTGNNLRFSAIGACVGVVLVALDALV